MWGILEDRTPECVTPFLCISGEKKFTHVQEVLKLGNEEDDGVVGFFLVARPLQKNLQQQEEGSSGNEERSLVVGGTSSPSVERNRLAKFLPFSSFGKRRNFLDKSFPFW